MANVPKKPYAQVEIGIKAAIPRIQLRQDELAIMDEVTSALFGRVKRTSVRLDRLEIGKAENIHPANIRAAVKALVEGNILVLNPDGTHSLNEDFEAWHPRGKRLADIRNGGALKAVHRQLALYGSPSPPANGQTLEFNGTPMDQQALEFNGTPHRVQRNSNGSTGVGVQRNSAQSSTELRTEFNGTPDRVQRNSENRGSRGGKGELVPRARTRNSGREEEKEEGGENSPPPISSLPSRREALDPELVRALELLQMKPADSRLFQELGKHIQAEQEAGRVPEGWRYWVAAHLGTSPESKLTGNQPFSLSFFLGVARQTDRNEYEKLRANASAAHLTPQQRLGAFVPPKRAKSQEDVA